MVTSSTTASNNTKRVAAAASTSSSTTATGKRPRILSNEKTTGTTKRSQANGKGGEKALKGLRHFSMKVCAYIYKYIFVNNKILNVMHKLKFNSRYVKK